MIVTILLFGCANQPDKKWRIGISQCSSDDWRKEMNDEVYREMMFHDDACNGWLDMLPRTKK